MVGAGSAFTKNVGAPDVARQRDFERKKDKHNQKETVAHSVSSESIGTKQITWRALRLKKNCAFQQKSFNAGCGSSSLPISSRGASSKRPQSALSPYDLRTEWKSSPC